MAAGKESREFELRDIEEEGEYLGLRTDTGTILCRWHTAMAGDAAVLWAFGAGGGLNGPAGGLYPRLATRLAVEGVASMELAYRHAGDLDQCILDVLLGVTYLGRIGRTRVALVGHSFGGAVAIAAGTMSPAVVGVAALSSQTYGTVAVDQLSPRPLLLVHGTQDQVLPDRCSRDLYRRAREPKELILYPGSGHGLDECREELDRDLLRWLRAVIAPPESRSRRTNSPRG